MKPEKPEGKEAAKKRLMEAQEEAAVEENIGAPSSRKELGEKLLSAAKKAGKAAAGLRTKPKQQEPEKPQKPPKPPKSLQIIAGIEKSVNQASKAFGKEETKKIIEQLNAAEKEFQKGAGTLEQRNTKLIKDLDEIKKYAQSKDRPMWKKLANVIESGAKLIGAKISGKDQEQAMEKFEKSKFALSTGVKEFEFTLNSAVKQVKSKQREPEKQNAADLASGSRRGAGRFTPDSFKSGRG